MGKKDISREHLYEAVKTLVETEHQHIQLNQQKLFTLFSIAFQYLLFRSTKKAGHYIIRLQDSYLAEKLARKAKDETTRKFLYKLLLPRKLKYGESTFHLDFFNVNTWKNTKDLPQDRVQGALIVKNTAPSPVGDNVFQEIDEQEEITPNLDLPENYYLTSLTDFIPKTITVSFGESFKGLEPIKFAFIKESVEVVNGVRIAADINVHDIE